MYVCILLTVAVSLAVGHRLPAPHDFQPEHQRQGSQEDRTLIKRNANPSPNVPTWGFFPLIASPPQVIQVHHIIHLQPPTGQCSPSGGYLPPRPPIPTSRPNTVDGGDVLNRMGGDNNQTSNTPSPCVWAIVSCCSPGNSNIRYACFELLGCIGAFWDLSPCEPRVVQAAANTALMFYMSATPPSNQSNVIEFDPPEEPDNNNN